MRDVLLKTRWYLHEFVVIRVKYAGDYMRPFFRLYIYVAISELNQALNIRIVI